MSCYVFRINYDDFYPLIRRELTAGRLRQGWGAVGMSVGEGSSLETFAQAWDTAWPGEGALNSPRVSRKYRNLGIMCQMQPGDLIVIPKVSIDQEEGWQHFTIVRCIGSYYFDPLDNNDFGHIIPVEPIVSVPYAHTLGRTVKRGFRCYQSPVNRVWNEGFIESIDLLLHEFEENPVSCRKETSSDIDALSIKAQAKKEEYLDTLIHIINSWDPSRLEHIIEELFVRNGYEKIGNNSYDRTGGDIDLIFRSYPIDTLMGTIAALDGDVQMPEIRIQAKNKCGLDRDDSKGVDQLLKMPDAEKSINIVINTTPEFSPDAKELAGRNVVLINGREFAALLLQYGLDVMDTLM